MLSGPDSVLGMLLLLKSEDSLRLVDQLNSSISGLRSTKSGESSQLKIFVKIDLELQQIQHFLFGDELPEI